MKSHTLLQKQKLGPGGRAVMGMLEEKTPSCPIHLPFSIFNCVGLSS